MREVRPNVFIEDRYSSPPGEYHGCNYGFVQTTDGIVVIDTPEWPSDAVSLADELSERGEVRFVVNTHEHIDHVAGNAFLPGTVVAHARAREHMSQPPGVDQAKVLFGLLFEEPTASRKRARVDELTDDEVPWGTFLRILLEDADEEGVSLLDEYRLTLPNVTFTDDMTLHVGEYSFELTYLPGHSDGHIGVYVPEAQVFFAGDNVATGVYPSLATSLPREWLESLRTIEAHDVDVVIPGHGAVCDLDEVREFSSFLDRRVRAVEDAIASGMSADEAAERIAFDDGRPALHSNRRADEMDVRRLYDQLS